MTKQKIKEYCQGRRDMAFRQFKEISEAPKERYTERDRSYFCGMAYGQYKTCQQIIDLLEKGAKQ